MFKGGGGGGGGGGACALRKILGPTRLNNLRGKIMPSTAFNR